MRNVQMPLALFIILFPVFVVGGTFILMWLYNHTAHEVLPGMTARGLVAKEIGFWTAFKLALLLGGLGLGLRK